MNPIFDLESELEYLGLLDKAREIYHELGERAVLSYIKSSHRLLSKVYHPDLNPAKKEHAQQVQQRLNRVSQLIGELKDDDLVSLVRRGMASTEAIRKKVLVVDDEASLRELYTSVLTMEGYDVRDAVDGKDGCRVYTAYRPNLILTDVVMPNMNGLEMVRHIRTITPSIKIVYISGFFGIEGIRRELIADIQKYGYPTLAKPFKMSALLEVVNTAFSTAATGGFRKGI